MMYIDISPSSSECGKRAAVQIVRIINDAIKTKRRAAIILATGNSQLAMLAELVNAEVEWDKVTVFHLDEYIGLNDGHPASFVGYLKNRFENKVSDLGHFHYINGAATNPMEECRRLNSLIGDVEIDVACVGIGENGHLAFNDPPADFETADPYIVVSLDEACRYQQLNEGWFPAIADVPGKAITMSIRKIMSSKAVVCTVPDERKATAVQKAVEGPVDKEVPASILLKHPAYYLYLDQSAASKLSRQTTI